MAEFAKGQRGWRRLDGKRAKDGTRGPGGSLGEIAAEGGWREGELDGEMVGPGAGDGDTMNAGSKDGRVEGLMDMAAWIDGDRLEFIKMGEGEDGAGDLPSPGGTTVGLLAVKRPGR